MPLNIKDPVAHELAKALAQETGETLTLPVIQALRERLQRMRRTRRRWSLMQTSYTTRKDCLVDH